MTKVEGVMGSLVAVMLSVDRAGEKAEKGDTVVEVSSYSVVE